MNILFNGKKQDVSEVLIHGNEVVFKSSQPVHLVFSSVSGLKSFMAQVKDGNLDKALKSRKTEVLSSVCEFDGEHFVEYHVQKVS